MIYNTHKINEDTIIQNTFSLLDSLPLIESEYITPNPTTIPLLESKEFNKKYITRYSDLENLAEEYDITIDDTIDLLTQVHPTLAKDQIIIAIEESRPYYDTDVLYRFFNEYVLIPEYNTPAYNLCDYCMTNFLESHDPFWIELYVTYPEITLSIQEAVVGKENKPGYLENMLSEINNRIAETKKSIQNPMMIDKQKKHLTNLMTQLDRQAMEIEDKIKERDGLQAARRQEKQNLQNNSTTAGGNSEMEAMKNMSNDAKKMIYKKNQEIRKLQNDSGNATTPNQPDTSNQSQSWLAKKWAAFKNWWGNTGSPNGDNGSGGGGWFSNLVGKIKSGLGIQAQQTNPTSNTTPTQSTPNTTPQTSSTTPVSNTPAKPAQPTPQQNATDANKQKAQQQTQQAVSNYNAVKQAVTNQQQANSIKK